MTNPDFDAFARLLDGDLPNGEATAEARTLSALAQAMAASAALPQMEHKADLRAVLVEAARQQASAPTLLSRFRQSVDQSTARWRYSMRMAAATGASALALSSGGVALAAHRATPSDPLFYDVKLVFEDIRLAFIGDAAERGEQLLAYANQRLAEAEAAAAAGDMAAARRALAEADEAGRSGVGYIIRASQEQGDPSLLALIDTFTKAQTQRLAALLPHLRGEAVDAADDAMIGLRRIDQRMAVLSGPCGDCGTVRSADAKDNKGKNGDQVAASDPDFDFSHIPPASEPFAPCPCVTDSEDTGTARDERSKGKKTAKEGKAVASEPADPPSGKGGDPGDGPSEPGPKDPGDDPGDKPGDGPGEEDPTDELPEPVREPVKDAEDVIDDVIDDVPVTPPPLPSPPPPGLP